MKKIFIKTALVVASTALSAIAGLQVAHADSYVVQQGDSFFGIASAHGMSPYDLAAKNGKSIFDTINPGDVLEVLLILYQQKQELVLKDLQLLD